MRRLFLVLLTASLAVGLGLSGAAVADENETDGTDADVPIEELVEELDDDVECERVVDAETCITDWSYAEGTFTITFHSDGAERVGLTEQSDWSEESQRFAYAEQRISDGETTITFSVYERNGAGVGIMSETARNAEQGGAIISTGSQADNPFRHFGGGSGFLSGVAITVLLALAGTGVVLSLEESGVKKA